MRASVDLARGQEIDRAVVMEDLDVGALAQRAEQAADDLPAGDVAGVKDAAKAVAAFARQVVFEGVAVLRACRVLRSAVGRAAIEAYTGLRQPLDRARAF